MMYIPWQFDEFLRIQEQQQKWMFSTMQRAMEAQVSMVQLQMSLIESGQRNLQKAMDQYTKAVLNYGDDIKDDEKSSTEAPSGVPPVVRFPEEQQQNA